VGPRFLAPGESQNVSVLIVPANSAINELKDLAVPEGASRPKIGVVQGVPTAGDLNSQSQLIDQELRNQSSGMRLRPVIDRYATLQELMQAVADGTDQAAVIQSTEFAGIKDQFPTLREASSITGEKSPVVSFWEPMILGRMC